MSLRNAFAYFRGSSHGLYIAMRWETCLESNPSPLRHPDNHNWLSCFHSPGNLKSFQCKRSSLQGCNTLVWASSPTWKDSKNLILVLERGMSNEPLLFDYFSKVQMCFPSWTTAGCLYSFIENHLLNLVHQFHIFNDTKLQHLFPSMRFSFGHPL